MTNFQIGAFVLLGFTLAATIALTLRHRLPGRLGAAWSVLWLGAMTAIAWPDSTVIVAHALGIARGADLVFYLAILTMLIGFFGVFVRMRRLESELTRVVRELALRAPAEPPNDEGIADR